MMDDDPNKTVAGCIAKFRNEPNFQCVPLPGETTFSYEQLESALRVVLRAQWTTRKYLRADGTEITGNVFMPEVADELVTRPSELKVAEGAATFVNKLWPLLADGVLLAAR